MKARIVFTRFQDSFPQYVRLARQGFSGMLLLGLFACQEYREQQLATYEAECNRPPKYRTVVIEGCEYLRFETTHSYAVLTHKGNCRNPVHCYRDTLAPPLPTSR